MKIIMESFQSRCKRRTDIIGLRLQAQIMILALVMLTFIDQIMEESILQISSGLEIMDNTRLFLLIDLIAL